MSHLPGRGQPFRPPSLLTSLIATCAAALALALPASAGAAPHLAGVQSHVLWANVSNAEMDRQLDRMKQLNVGITRVDVGWASIEPDAKGQHDSWYLSRLDHLVQGANARGIKLLLLFAETPCWASTAPDSLKQGCQGAWWDRDVQNYAPRHMSDYADALAFVVKRYGDQVYSWEIWNEPNQDYFFHTSDPVGDYANMVRAAYPAAKAADPRPIIVAGSLSVSDFEFTDALYRHGVKGYFDAWSIHPYTSGGPNHHAFLPDDVSIGDLPKMKAVLDAAVAAGTVVSRRPPAFWVTEFSWDSRPPDPAGVPAQLLVRWVAEGFYRMWRSGVSLVTWFLLRDAPQTTLFQSGLYYRGTTIQQDRPKPELAAFRFPFVAFPAPGRRISVWGRTPRGRRAAVLVEQRIGRRWKRLGVVQTDTNGILQARLPRAGAGLLVRASTFDGARAVPFSLRPTVDRVVDPFGSIPVHP